MKSKSIPAGSEKQDNVNTLQIAAKTRITFIYRPQLQAEQPDAQCQ